MKVVSFPDLRKLKEQIHKKLQFFKVPFLILILIVSMCYLLLERSIYFPRVANSKITLGSMPFQGCMLLILFISIIRCYYFNEFTYLWIMESQYVYTSVKKSVRSQLTEVEDTYFSIRRLKGLLRRLEFFHYRVCTVMNCVLKHFKSGEIDNYSIAVQELHKNISRPLTTESDRELQKMMAQMRSHCSKTILNNSSIESKRPMLVNNEQNEEIQSLFDHLTEAERILKHKIVSKKSKTESIPSYRPSKDDLKEQFTDQSIASKLEELMDNLKQGYNIQIPPQTFTQSYAVQDHDYDLEELEEVMLSECNLDPDAESVLSLDFEESPTPGLFLHNF